MAKIVLSGYYGFNNVGDEAILYTIIRTLKEIEPTLEFTILAHDPEKMRKYINEEGITAVNRWSVPDVFRAISRCDLFISGGGSLLQDVSSANGILYYLGLIWLAHSLEKPVLLYAQGIGPVVRTRNKRVTGWILNGVNKITVRDQESKDDLVAMGVQQEITVTADPVFCLYKQKPDPKIGLGILQRYGLLGRRKEQAPESGLLTNREQLSNREQSQNSAPLSDSNSKQLPESGVEVMPGIERIEKQEKAKLLGLYLRPWNKNEYLPALVDALRQMAEKGWKLVFVPMHFPGDITIAREAARLLSDYQPVILKERYSPVEILSLTSHFDLVLGMRLHSLIMAAVCGVPLVGLSYDHKIDRFLRQIGQVALFSTNNLDAQRLAEMLSWTDQNRGDLLKEMDSRVQVMYQKAWSTARIAIGMLEGKE